jgi:transcriptional antiterminator RfaH
MRRWYAVHTHPNADDKAAFHLRRQGFSVYAPKYRRKRRHARREEIVARPLFPRYVFLSLDVQTQQWHAVNSTVGVTGLVCAGAKPVPVPDAVIQSISDSEDRDGFVRLSPPSMRAGDSVRITAGALADCTGIFECMDDNARVTLLLSFMGRAIKVRVAAEDVVRAA